jgi:hypothetical protein
MRYVLLTSLALATAGPAQSKDAKPIELTVAPMGHSMPALQWRLLPSPYELRPGDAAEIYHEIYKKGGHRWDGQGSSDYLEYDRRRMLSLDATERKRIEGYLTTGAETLAALDRAKFCDSCRWKADLRGARIYVDADVEEVQDARALFRLLSLRTRWRAAQGDGRGAIGSLQTQFALARHCGEHRSLTGRLIGATMESLSYKDVLEVVQTPGCPNLFWALGALPEEVIDVRAAVAFERGALLNHVPKIRDADKLNLTPDEWLKVVEEYVATSVNYPRGSPFEDKHHRMTAGLLMLRAYTPGKAHLARQGMDAAAVERMPAGKVVAIYLRDEFYDYCDDMLKWVALPPYRVVEHYQQAAGEQRSEERNQVGFTARLMPDLLSVSMSPWYARHRRAFAQTVEALRAHAAENDGRLPESLAEVKLPPPLDPYTNRPLVYAKSGDAATLKADHEKILPCFNVKPVVLVRINVVKGRTP